MEFRKVWSLCLVAACICGCGLLYVKQLFPGDTVHVAQLLCYMYAVHAWGQDHVNWK